LVFENYHVIGLQRTGTNWLHALIKENFAVKRKQTFWKHLTPLGQAEEDKDYGNLYGPAGSDLFLDPKVFYVVTDKEFGKWIESLKKRRVDFWVSHNFYKEEKTYEEVYDSWQDWKEKNLEQKNFFYKPYEEWNKNWKMYLNEIQKITKWKRKHSEFVGVYRRF
jgi:hypothetical protein